MTRTERLLPPWAVALFLALTVSLINLSEAAAAGQLVVNLPLDETSGTTAADLSGSGNNGTLQSGPTWTPGRWNGALSFDGNNDVLFISDSPSLDPPAGAITVAAWVYRTANVGHWVSVASRQFGNTYFEHFYLGFSDTGQYRWFVNTTSGYSSTAAGGTAPLGQWVHVVGTYDGAFVRLYANGVEQFSIPHSGTFAPDSTGVTIGASHNDAAHAPIEAFSGKVDEFRIYRGALTPAEVVQLYQSVGGSFDGPPTVTLTSPAPGTVKGTIAASATAFDVVGVAGVQFMVDGNNNGPEDTTAPYTTNIDTTAYAEGPHVLTALARDTTGNVTISSPVNVTFDNVAVMPLGDSLTAGFVGEGSPNNQDGGYRRYLWADLRSAGIVDMNFVGSLQSGIPTMDRDHEGHGGFRIDQLTDSVATWIPAFSPDIILLLIGTNDLIQGANVPVASNRLATLLDRIHDLRPGARILLATEPGMVQGNIFGIDPQSLVDYNVDIRALVSNRAAQGWDIVLVDLYNLAGLNRAVGSPDYNPDGLHLTPQGYSKLSAPWFAALDPDISSDTTPPSIPTGLSASATSSSVISLSWNASTDDQAGVAAYRVYRDAIPIAMTAGTTYQDTGLIANTTYSYAVTAIDWVNNESGPSTPGVARTPAPAGDVTPPSVPTGLAATAASSTSIGLTWTGSTDGGTGATASDTFNRANGGLGSGWTAVSGSFRIVNQHVEVVAPDTYTAAQVASWAGGSDQWAEAAVTVVGPNSGGGPIVRVGNGGNNLYLVDYNGRADHKLYQAVGGVFTPLGGWTSPASVGDVVRLEATGATIRVLVNGVQKVAVTNGAVTGGVPGLYSYMAAGEQLQLDTFAAGGGGVPAAGYRIYRNGSAVGTTAATTYLDTGRQPNTSYTYAVTAYDASGNESAASAAASATTLPATAAPTPSMALPFNEGSGTVAGDVSGNGNHGTLKNGPVWTTGVTGTALQFDGNNDVVEVAPSATIAALSSQVTVAAWVYRTANQGNWAAVVSRQQGTSYFEHFYLGVNNTGQYRWFVNTTSGYSSTTMGVAAPVGQWQHVVGTYDGTQVRFYVNGVQQFATPHTGTLASDTTGLVIGAGHNDAAHTPIEPFAGRIDEVRLYGMSLDAAAVTALYQSSQQPSGDVTPPSVPTGLAATAASSTSIGLTWTGSTDGGTGATASDTFNRANGGLGSGWTAVSGSFRIVNQHVEVVAPDTYTAAQVASWAGGSDQWAEAAVTVVGPNSGGGPIVRVGNGGNNLYLVDYNGRADHKLYQAVGGVFTPLGGWTSPASVGDVVRLEATGATIRVLVNGVQKVAVTNGAVTGGVPGLYSYMAAGEQLQLDTFAAGGGGVPAAGYRIYRNGSAVGTTAATTYLDTGRQPNTSYTYAVTAYDASGNESAASAAASATTLPATAAPTPSMALPFNEGSGTVAGDVSGNGNHGTLKNGPVWTTGVTGTALQFDGNNDVVEVAPSATIAALSSQVTVAAWVYRTANQGNWAAVVSRQQGTSYFEHFYLGVNNTGQYRWFVNTTSGYSSTTMGVAAPVGQWQHVVGTYDGTQVRFYVNGVQQFATPHTGTLASDTTGLVIGAGHNDAAHTPIEPFAGRIDEVRVYPVALTPEQVQALYSS